MSLTAVAGLQVVLADRPVLGGLSLSVRHGEVVGIMGPPEAGKSVLLKAIAGLLPWAGGTLTHAGVAVAAGSDAWRRQVGFAFQNDALFDALSARDNVAFALRQRGVPEAEVATRAAAALAAVDLSGSADALPESLSGGMKKRVGIARAIVTEPSVGCFDEPVAGLDPLTARRIMDLLVAPVRSGAMAALIVSNDLPTLLPVCDRAVMLLHGEILYDGPPAQMAAATAPAAVRQFVLGAADGPL